MNKLISFFKQEDGATAIEYGLIAALISVAIIGTVSTLGSNMGATFTSISDAITAVTDE